MQQPNRQIRETQSRSDDGFTLIELAIVLVIIGLIAGGVLVGRNLIEIAQARSLMSQMEKIQVAASTFRLKYNCIAGDCDKATLLGIGSNGNGDGYVGSTTSGVSCLTSADTSTCFTHQPYTDTKTAFCIFRGYGELQYFWAHLSAAGLIGESLATLPSADVDITDALPLYFPKDAMGKAYLQAFSWNNRLYIRTGMNDVYSVFTNSTFQTAILSSTQMSHIDSKVSSPPINVNVTRGYPDALAQGQRVLPIGISSQDGNERYVYMSPATAAPAAEFAACVVADGAGGYKYNISAGGNCNMFWQIDY